MDGDGTWRCLVGLGWTGSLRVSLGTRRWCSALLGRMEVLGVKMKDVCPWEGDVWIECEEVEDG
jgi:hypothetical protein